MHREIVIRRERCGGPWTQQLAESWFFAFYAWKCRIKKLTLSLMENGFSITKFSFTSFEPKFQLCDALFVLFVRAATRFVDWWLFKVMKLPILPQILAVLSGKRWNCFWLQVRLKLPWRRISAPVSGQIQKKIRSSSAWIGWKTNFALFDETTRRFSPVKYFWIVNTAYKVNCIPSQFNLHCKTAQIER